MNIKIKVSDYMCLLEKFEINGIKAEEKDFGEHYDHCPELADDYGCGCMQFDKTPATDEVLKKYCISLTDYEQICNILENEFDFGACGACV